MVGLRLGVVERPRLDEFAERAEAAAAAFLQLHRMPKCRHNAFGNHEISARVDGFA
jgi:hypothetical protein